MSDAKLSSLALNTFRNYSEYLVDYGRFRTLDSASLFKALKKLTGREHIEEAQRRANGAIVLTVHLGNWELGGHILRQTGLEDERRGLTRGQRRDRRIETKVQAAS